MSGFSLHGSYLRDASLQRVASVTLFLSAFLLLGVQPMLGRMVMPFFGGSPMGWLIVLILLQITLACAYGYSAWLTRHTSPTTQLYVHFSLIIAAILSLPLALVLPTDSSLLWFFISYGLSIGLLLFVNAANAPLLQHWFSGTPHPRARDPYFLYVASNVGSLSALILYVLVIEPHLTLAQQSQWWSFAFVVLASMVALFGIWTTRLRTLHHTTHSLALSPTARSPLIWRQRLTWALLAFVPSSLLHATTLHITSTLTSAPLLWVVPLLIYFLTFTLSFARKPPLSHRFIHLSHGFAIVLYGLFLILFATPPDILFSLTLVLVVMFTSALICHAKLTAKRPPPEHLGSFYLWFAIGIALGGLFNALLAPLLFDSLIEYPLMLILACLLRSNVARPPQPPRNRRRLMDGILPLALLAGISLAVYVTETYPAWVSGVTALVSAYTLWLALLAVPAVFFLSVILACRPMRFALSAVVLLVVPSTLHTSDQTLLQWRNLFGIYRVTASPTGDIHSLYRGVALQDKSQVPPSNKNNKATPVAYFHRSSPLGEVMTALRKRGRPLRVAMVGAGIGSVACYQTFGDEFTLMTLDKETLAVAQQPRYFDYLSTCGSNATLVIGDLAVLAQQANQHYDLIIINTLDFTSVPLHLLTLEALSLYQRKLKGDGVMLFHLSHPLLDLSLPLASTAHAQGLTFRHKRHHPSSPQARRLIVPSHYAVLATSESSLPSLFSDSSWLASAPPYLRPWQDDYVNILAPLLLPYISKHAPSYRSAVMTQFAP
ncbi:MAG: hypothetical protein GDA50_04950 [Alphaproteobacteria bacterium GM202ARS2]|nr:hypothetical protein [Alphaproteobacteria bacterium GM202ARS2]